MNTIFLKTKKQLFYTVGMLFVLCSIVEYIEFLFIRTDQTIIADNVFTKIFCIIATLGMVVGIIGIVMLLFLIPMCVGLKDSKN